jgi:hypothetical protein
VRIYSSEALRNNQKGSLVQVFKERIRGEQINTLILRFDYVIEKDPEHYIDKLVIDRENATDAKIQNTFRYLATREIKL